MLNSPSLSDVEGVLVGHWTDDDARTGCTVVLFPEGTVASGEVRGGSPASRDTELLAPAASVQRLDAVVLSGGSAFGLAAADGVMRWCEEHDRGVETPAGKVPIVVGLSIFDLVVGDPSVPPERGSGSRRRPHPPRVTRPVRVRSARAPARRWGSGGAASWPGRRASGARRSATATSSCRR